MKRIPKPNDQLVYPKYDATVKCVSNSGTLLCIKLKDLINQIKDRPDSLRILKLGVHFSEMQYREKIRNLEEIYSRYLK